MAEINVTVNSQRVQRKLLNIERAMPGEVRKGFIEAGIIFERDMKKKVSGPGRIRNNSNVSGPYSRFGGRFPGVVTGQLRRTISYKVSGSGRDTELVVGPKVSYAEFLELGTKFINPPYAFVGPTYIDKIDEGINRIHSRISGVLDR